MPNLEFPMIETQRLLLNKLTMHDREPLFAIFSDPKIIEHYDVERFTLLSILLEQSPSGTAAHRLLF
jgi:hypothetical protein